MAAGSSRTVFGTCSKRRSSRLCGRARRSCRKPPTSSRMKCCLLYTSRHHDRVFRLGIASDRSGRDAVMGHSGQRLGQRSRVGLQLDSGPQHSFPLRRGHGHSPRVAGCARNAGRFLGSEQRIDGGRCRAESIRDVWHRRRIVRCGRYGNSGIDGNRFVDCGFNLLGYRINPERHHDGYRRRFRNCLLYTSRCV